MSARERKLPSSVNPSDAGAVRKAFHDIGTRSVPAARVNISASAEGAFAANTRQISVTVVDLQEQRWEGRWIVAVYLTTAADADPDGTGNTVTFEANTVNLEEFVANSGYLLLTNANGVAVFNVAIVGAASRVVAAVVLGQIQESDPLAWA